MLAAVPRALKESGTWRVKTWAGTDRLLHGQTAHLQSPNCLWRAVDNRSLPKLCKQTRGTGPDPPAAGKQRWSFLLFSPTLFLLPMPKVVVVVVAAAAAGEAAAAALLLASLPRSRPEVLRGHRRGAQAPPIPGQLGGPPPREAAVSTNPQQEIIAPGDRAIMALGTRRPARMLLAGA